MQLKNKDPFGNYSYWKEKPYGVRVEFEIDGEYFLDEEETLPSFIGIWDEACILLSETHIFHLERDKAGSKHEGKNIWNTYIEGFETASKAESAGKWFATALMFNSVMYSPCVRIKYSLPDPYEVYSRRLPKKPKMRSFLSIKSADLNQKRKKSIDNLRKVWLSTEGSNIPEQLYLALELYTSSQFENSEQAKLIGIISAIESLAKQKDYSQDENYNIDSVLMGLCEELDTNKLIPGPIRESIKGQIKNLKRESISRACHRLINSQLPEYNGAIDIFNRAYRARSELLHEGETTYDLPQISYEIQELVRRLLLTFLPSK